MSTAEKQTTHTHRHAPHRRTHRRTHTTWFFIGGLLLWFYIGVVLLHLQRDVYVLPAWILLGAGLVPATIFWIMVHRLRTTDTVTAVNLVVAAVIGGTSAIALGGTLDQLVESIPQPVFQNEGLFGLLLAGLVEEFSKGVLIVIVGWKIAKTTRNGLFIGGAVGLGFAVLESMGYVYAHVTGADPIITAAMEAEHRGLYAPFCHVLWSALFGAALFTAAAKRGRFRLSWLVIGTYVGVALLHGTWDGAAPLVLALTDNMMLATLTQFVAYLVAILVGGLIWRHIARKEPAPAIAESAASEGPAPVAPAQA